MTITNPAQLVDEFKKSGEFDRLRRELLKNFQQSDGITAFRSKIEEIVQARLQSDQKLQYLPQENVHRELMQEVDRFPVVERAAADVRLLLDPVFASAVKKSVHRILREDRGEASGLTNEIPQASGDVKHRGMGAESTRQTLQHESPSRPSPPSIPIDIIPASPGPPASENINETPEASVHPHPEAEQKIVGTVTRSPPNPGGTIRKDGDLSEQKPDESTTSNPDH